MQLGSIVEVTSGNFYGIVYDVAAVDVAAPAAAAAAAAVNTTP
jgi:hypothetical protein